MAQPRLYHPMDVILTHWGKWQQGTAVGPSGLRRGATIERFGDDATMLHVDRMIGQLPPDLKQMAIECYAKGKSVEKFAVENGLHRMTGYKRRKMLHDKLQAILAANS